MSTVGDPYQLLRAPDCIRLRQERVLELEADHYRGALRIADAQSETERESLAAGMDEIAARLAVHYAALGLDSPEPSEKT